MIFLDFCRNLNAHISRSPKSAKTTCCFGNLSYNICTMFSVNFDPPSSDLLMDPRTAYPWQMGMEWEHPSPISTTTPVVESVVYNVKTPCMAMYLKKIQRLFQRTRFLWIQGRLVSISINVALGFMKIAALGGDFRESQRDFDRNRHVWPQCQNTMHGHMF